MSEEQFLVSSDVDDEGDGDDLQQTKNGGIRKNLLDDFADLAKTDSTVPSNGREFMKVFLRVRPFMEEEIDACQDQKCMDIHGETAILLNAPKDSFSFKNEKRGREVTHRFTFSHVFGQETTQKAFFDNTSLDVVKDFMDGQNCLVFTYGVTNSGKTYTIQGTPKDGGILPRTLDVLFNSIQHKHYPRMNLKPRYFCDIVKVSDKQEHMEAALRNGLLMSLNKEHFDLNSFLQIEESNADITKGSIGDESSLQASMKSQEGDVTGNDEIACEDDDASRVADGTSISVDAQGPVKFSVWISFAEIYNELIFDLLDPCPDGKGKKRVTLKLGDDKNGNPYIKGLREICVSSADEAYKILRVGKKNQRIAATRLNQSSSRSHCIFSIKVLRVVDVDNPHVARVSRLSFVDLAGSERYNKTQSTGDRLKESGNINTSLMTLGKCLESLRQNQMHPNHPQIIPFRESKLTRLFQGFFCGKGKASMIVNINQCAHTFDETYHALKFSAIAKQVTTKVSKPIDMAPPIEEKSFRPSFAFPISNKVPRMSIAWENGSLTTPAASAHDNGHQVDEGDRVTLYIKQLENLVRQFQDQLIDEKKQKATLELKIREEVCTEMAEQLVAIETAYSERIQEEVSAVEEKCDRRIELLAKSVKKSRKRARIERQDEDNEESAPIAQLNEEQEKNKEMTAQIKLLETNIQSMKTSIEDDEKRFEEQEDIMVELQSALETSSKELEIAKIKIDKRDRMLKEKDTKIEELQTEFEKQKNEVQLKAENQEKLQQKLEEESNMKTSSLKELNQLVENIERSLAEKQQLLNEKSQALEEGTEKIAVLEKEKRSLVDEKEGLLAGSDCKSKILEEELKDTVKKVHESNAMLEQSRESLKQLEDKLQGKDEVIAEKTNLLDNKDSTIKTLENNLKEHRQALENNETFLAQLNEDVKRLTTDLTDAQNKHQEKEEQKDVRLETALAKKISKLREQLLAKDELMKELVQSLEETRAQVELEKGDLVMVCNEQKKKIAELRQELEVQKDNTTDDDEVKLLKERLQKAINDSLNVKEEFETSSFEKEELQLALDAANGKVSQLEEELKAKAETAMKEDELVTSLSEANSKVLSLQEVLVKRDEEITALQNRLKSVNSSMQKREETAMKEDELLTSLSKANSKANSKVLSLQEVLVKRDEEITALQNRLKSVNSSMQKREETAMKEDELLTSLSKANSKVLSLQEVLDKKDEEITALQNQLKSVNSSMQKREETAMKEDELLNALSEANSKVLDKKDEEITVLQNQLKSVNSSMQKREETAMKEDELLNALSEANSKVLVKKDEKITALQNQLESVNRSSMQKREETAMKEDELLNTLSEANSKVLSVQEVLVKKDEEITALQNQLKSVNSSMATLDTENQKAKELFKKLEDEVTKQEKSVADLEELKQLKFGLDAENERVVEELQTKDRELNNLMSDVERLTQELQKSGKVNEDLKNNLNTMEDKIAGFEKTNESNDQTQVMEVEKTPVSDVKELEKQLKATTIALDKKNSQLISRNNTVKRLKLSVTEKEAEISELSKGGNTPSSATPGRDFRSKEEIKTLRRRLVQADKEIEESRQKAQEYEKKIDEFIKTAEENRSELIQATEKLKEFEERLSAVENERNDAQKNVGDLAEKFEASKLELELHRKLESEAKEKSTDIEKEMKKLKDEADRDIEKLSKDAEKLRKEIDAKTCELNNSKTSVGDYEKKLREVETQHSEKMKENEDKMASLLERTKNAEVNMRNNDQTLKSLQESKDLEITQLQALLQTKEKHLEQKGQELDSVKKQFSDTEKEKSDELDKVWKTLVELQEVIKQRGETIDSLEDRLSKAEARYSREKTTLENTVAKMKEVMETKGGDRRKHISQIVELEANVESLNVNNKVLIQASENREKDVEELKKVLEQQDAVMEEQQVALNERQSEIESLVCDNTRLQEVLDAKDTKGVDTTAEVHRLQGTLSVFEQEKQKLEQRLKNADERQKEYESLCQLKDADVRAANEDKSTMLKAMREALAVAAAKKEEFQAKIKEREEELNVEHAKEIEKLKEQIQDQSTSKSLEEIIPSSELENSVNKKPPLSSKKRERKARGPTTRSKKTDVNQDKNCTSLSNEEGTEGKENNDVTSVTANQEENVSRDDTSVTNTSTKILRDQPIPDDRIEIDVTPIQRRKRTSRAPGGSKTKPKKRRSSELPLSEIKSQMSANRFAEQSEDDFTPGSVTQKGTKRTRPSTVRSSSPSCSSKKQRPPATPLAPMNKEKIENVGLKNPTSVKKKRFFGGIFSSSGGSETEENTPVPKSKGRKKLLKKDISVPMNTFSPCIARIDTGTSSARGEKNKVRTIITRQLRSGSRAAK